MNWNIWLWLWKPMIWNWFSFIGRHIPAKQKSLARLRNPFLELVRFYSIFFFSTVRVQKSIYFSLNTLTSLPDVKLSNFQLEPRYFPCFKLMKNWILLLVLIKIFMIFHHWLCNPTWNRKITVLFLTVSTLMAIEPPEVISNHDWIALFIRFCQFEMKIFFNWIYQMPK